MVTTGESPKLTTPAPRGRPRKPRNEDTLMEITAEEFAKSIAQTNQRGRPRKTQNQTTPRSSSTGITAGESSKSTQRGRPRKPRNQNKQIGIDITLENKQQLLSLLSSSVSLAHRFFSQNELHLLPSQCLSFESHLSSLPCSISPSLSPSPCNFFRRFLSSDSSDSDPRWNDIFRMSKSTFFHLISLLSPSLDFLPDSIPLDSAVAATLFRLAHGASYEASAGRFGLDSPAAACLAFYSVCKAVNDNLANLVDFASDVERILVGFGWISFPNCCGVLGFGKFGIDGDVLGKNGSLLVQALVDCQGRFLDISAGWPCTMKPDTIFNQTKLYSRIEQSKELLRGPNCELNDGNSIPQYILGDSCFPLCSWLLTPYNSVMPNEEGLAQRQFNASHSKVMKLVSTAFGRVKSRWLLLARRWNEDCVEFFPFVIVMGCLLHNFLIKCSDSMPEETVGSFIEEEEAFPVFQGEENQKGARIRDALAVHLNRVHGR